MIRDMLDNWALRRSEKVQKATAESWERRQKRLNAEAQRELFLRAGGVQENYRSEDPVARPPFSAEVDDIVLSAVALHYKVLKYHACWATLITEKVVLQVWVGNKFYAYAHQGKAFLNRPGFEERIEKEIWNLDSLLERIYVWEDQRPSYRTMLLLDDIVELTMSAEYYEALSRP